MSELPIIQKAYDFILWYVPILGRLPRDHKFNLGDRIVTGLYKLLEELIVARYTQEKLPHLTSLNVQLEILRYQTRLLLDLKLISVKRYEYAAKQVNSIEVESTRSHALHGNALLDALRPVSRRLMSEDRARSVRDNIPMQSVGPGREG
jgi:hypothetical protein